MLALVKFGETILSCCNFGSELRYSTPRSVIGETISSHCNVGMELRY